MRRTESVMMFRNFELVLQICAYVIIGGYNEYVFFFSVAGSVISFIKAIYVFFSKWQILSKPFTTASNSLRPPTKEEFFHAAETGENLQIIINWATFFPDKIDERDDTRGCTACDAKIFSYL